MYFASLSWIHTPLKIRISCSAVNWCNAESVPGAPTAFIFSGEGVHFERWELLPSWDRSTPGILLSSGQIRRLQQGHPQAWLSYQWQASTTEVKPKQHLSEFLITYCSYRLNITLMAWFEYFPLLRLISILFHVLNFSNLGYWYSNLPLYYFIFSIQCSNETVMSLWGVCDHISKAWTSDVN